MKHISCSYQFRALVTDRGEESQQLLVQVLSFRSLFISSSNLFVSLMIQDQTKQGLRDKCRHMAKLAFLVKIKMRSGKPAPRIMRDTWHFTFLVIFQNTFCNVELLLLLHVKVLLPLKHQLCKVLIHWNQQLEIVIVCQVQWLLD